MTLAPGPGFEPDRSGVRRVRTTSGVLVVSEAADGRPSRPVVVQREGIGHPPGEGGSVATDPSSVKIMDIIMH